MEDLITVFEIPLPDDSEIRNIILEFAQDLDIDIAEDVLNEITISFKGLNEFQIKQILNLVYQEGGCLDFDDKQLIFREKEQLVKKVGLLEMILVSEDINDIGGLENLKDWLGKKERIFNQLDKAIKFGVDIPKGMMIVGMPGCGKSLAAKATAKLFKVPLVRLDVGRLLGKYIGETVALLSKLNVDKHIDVEIKLDELDLTSAESKATYAKIKEYILEKFGLKVPTLYIAQIKKKCGIELRENYNKSKKKKQVIPQCTPEKEEAIMDALRHFKMI